MSKFCKICKDSGKPNSVVRSHNVRERGKVVCPILLSTECRYCRVKGHTPKFCPKIKDREMRIGAVPRNGNFRTSRHGQRRNIQHIKTVTHKPSVVAMENHTPITYESEDESLSLFDMKISKIPWGDGPGEDEPFQKELLDIINQPCWH